MKALTLIFVVLIALLQYPLWLGKGSWLRVWNLNTQITAQQEKNDALKMRNEALNAEAVSYTHLDVYKRQPPPDPPDPS